MNTVLIKNKKIQVRLVDFAIMQLFIVCFAFSDIRILSIVSTIFAFLIMAIDIIKKAKISGDTLKFFIFKILFITWSILSYLWSVNKSDTLYYSLTLILRLMLSLSILFYVDSPKKLELLFKFIVLAALIFSIRIILVVPISAYGEARIGNYLSFDGESSYGNTGLTYVLGIACAILIFSDKKIIKNNYLKYFLVVIFTTLSLLSGSKKQIIFIVIELFILVFKISKNRLQLLRNLAIVCVPLVLFFYLIFTYDTLYNIIGVRFENMLKVLTNKGGAANVDPSTANRSKFIVYAWNVFKSSPILGVGLDCFKYFNPIEQVWAECNYLELLADLGLVGFIFYYMPHFTMIIWLCAKRNNKGKNYYMLLCLMAFLLAVDFTMVSYRSTILQLWLSIAYAIFIIQKRTKNEELRNNS